MVEKGKEVAIADELAVDGKKLERARIASELGRYVPDKGQVLELLERWEDSIYAGVLFAAPNAKKANEAYSVAIAAFLREEREN